MQSVWAYAVSKKGLVGEEWLPLQILDDVATVGVQDGRLVVKSDQEESVKELQEEILKLRTKRHGAATALENSRLGDLNSNAKVERAVQEVMGVTRALKMALEERTKGAIHLDHPVVPWLVRHSTQVLNRYQIRGTGKTSYRMIK